MEATNETGSEIKVYGKVKSNNAKLEISKIFLDDIYINLLKTLDGLDKASKEYLQTWTKVFILSHMVQNDWAWFTIRDLQETLKLPLEGIEGETWRWFIKNFVYRLYKKGFLERKAVLSGTLAYAYRVRMERVRNPEIFLYESYKDLVREGLVDSPPISPQTPNRL